MRSEIRSILTRALVWALAIATLPIRARAQGNNPSGLGTGAVQAQLGSPFFITTPISATAAVNVASVLTLPAPSNVNLFNYVCNLWYDVNNDNTATAISNVAWTSTNFFSYGGKLSMPSAASNDTGVQTVINASPGGGCVKSAAGGTATVFTSPSGVAHAMWNWGALYYVGP